MPPDATGTSSVSPEAEMTDASSWPSYEYDLIGIERLLGRMPSGGYTVTRAIPWLPGVPHCIGEPPSLATAPSVPDAGTTLSPHAASASADPAVPKLTLSARQN